MKDEIIKVIDEYKKDNNYIIDNYTLEQKIEFLKQFEQFVLNDPDEYEKYDLDLENFKIFNSNEAQQILLNMISNQDKLDLDNNFSDNFMVMNLDETGYKIFFENYAASLSDSDIINIISYMIKDPNVKLNYYQQFKEFFKGYSLYNFFDNLDNSNINIDKLIVEAINTLKNESDDYHIELLIQKINDPNEKLFAVINFGYSYSALFSDVLQLCSDETKSSAIDKFSDILSSDELIDLIASITNDDIKINHIKNHIAKSNISLAISSIKDDFKKIEMLNLYRNEFSFDNSVIIEILLSIKDEILKIQTLNYVKTSFSEYNIKNLFIKTSTDELRKKFFDQFEKNNSFLKSAISSFEDDNIKLDYLYQYRSVMNTEALAAIIKSFKSDSLKLSFINSNNNLELSLRLDIINSISDINLRMTISVKEAINNQVFGWLHEQICHDDNLIRCKNINQDLIKFYSTENSINLDNLTLLVEKYGYIFLRFVKNENIKKIINSDKITLNKFLDLFDIEKAVKLNESNITSIYDSLIQRIFRIKNEDNILDLNIEIEQYIESKDLNNINIIINKIKDSELINFEDKIIDIDNFVQALLSKDESALSLLREIVNEYIVQKRNIYFKNRKLKMNKDLNLKQKYEKNYFMKQFFSKVDLSKIDELNKLLEKIDLSELDEDCVKLLNDKNIFMECLKFKKDPTNYNGNLDIVKKYLKSMNIIIEILYKTNYEDLENILSYIYEPDRLVFNFGNINKENIIKVMLEIDIDQLNQNLFNDEVLYQNLSKILYKYKFLGWDNVFEKLLNEADIGYDDAITASLIKYFYKIYPTLLEKIEKDELKSINLISLLDEALIFESSSNVYQLLLDKENYELIVKNPTPNAATGITKEERLKQIPDLIVQMFNRKFITIPTIDENIKIKGNKDLNVTIGNTTDIINFTYGERTGACMRIGGHADNLFKFCMKNENAFHIMITNPATGKLVSRVSGFRNGNSVFLNQLRDSLDINYTNEDLINLIEKVSKILIDRTKNSEYPIENIIISDGYAMKGRAHNKINLSQDIKSGYDYFYTDVSSTNAILIASSNDDNSLVDLKLGPDNSEKYPVLRQKIKYITDKREIYHHMSRLNLINRLMKNDPNWMENSNFDIENSNISKLFVGEDWYIALDKYDNIIDQFYMERNSEIILQEINHVKDNFINNIDNVVKEGFAL